jgi:hypothetical protein
MYDFQNNTIKKLEKLTDCTTLIDFLLELMMTINSKIIYHRS